MKTYGKYEKRPEAAAKQPQVKSVLLQTYFTSLLSLVLCVTMFLGTSYAWFSSEVTNTANEIYVGTLAVGLYKQEGDTRLDLAGSDIQLFDKGIRWEPGYTTLETIQVVNKGDLAFKYVLNFTDGKLDGDGNLADIAKHFEVWVYDHYKKAAPAPTSYGDISEEEGWESIGTLAEVLAGTPVLKDKVMETVRDTSEETPVNEGTSDGVGTTDTYTIALHMKESADSSVMGRTIQLSVKLVAYQMASESDAFGSEGYDSGLHTATNAEELEQALEAGESVMLLSDLTIASVEDTLTMNGGSLDGNGNTITYNGGKNTNGYSAGVLTTTGGKIQNLNIASNISGRAVYVENLASDLTVSGCTLDGAYSFNVNSSKVTGKIITFTDTIFKSWVSYANVVDHAYFTDCYFTTILKPYGDTTLTNCRFEAQQGLDVSELQPGETITLIGCTYCGTPIENAVLTASGGTVTIEGTDLLTVTAENMVALTG